MRRGLLSATISLRFLARSLSAFYALFGGLVWILSFDTAQYRTVIYNFGCAVLGLGIILLSVDMIDASPRFWTWIEGSVAILYGNSRET